MHLLAVRTFKKDPQEILDYTVDWSLWLNTDTISSASWTVEPGITSVLETKTTTAVTIWLSGGTLGTSYTAASRIITVGGRTAERTIVIHIVSK